MALKVVFIDDDETSLFAWQKLIPWAECGYEDAKVFSSSTDAMDYVRNNPVDVIITDIYMPGLDGLEIVDICDREQPFIKVILISAYRDFEYAQKALRYKNVVDYITKPLKYDSVISVLKRISQDADENQTEFSTSEDTYFRMQFFFELLCGNIESVEDVEKSFEKIGINIQPEKAMCTFCVFQIKQFSEFLKNISKYNSMQVYNAMGNLHPFCKDNSYFSFVVHSYTNVTWIVIESTDSNSDTVNKFISDISNGFQMALGAEITIKSCKSYNSVLELVNVEWVDDELKDAMDKDVNSDVIDTAIAYMKKHLSENIVLNDVAREVFMSPNYFSSYFKMKTGEKFIDYLSTLRMEEAASILVKDETLSVLDVCNMVGYSHLGYFYKKFKNHYGLTPMEYKGKNQKQSGDKK